MGERLASIPLVSSSIGDDYNPTLCTICQKNKKGGKVGSKPNGRSEVIDAANIRKGNALNRLISFHRFHFYLFAVCLPCHQWVLQRTRTMSKTLKQIQFGDEGEDVNMEINHTDNMPPWIGGGWVTFWKFCLYPLKEKRNVKSSTLINWQCRLFTLITAFMRKRYR